MSTIVLQNAPRNLDLVSFKSVLDSYGGLAKTSRFVVKINPIGIFLQQLNSNSITRDLIYLTEIAEMPGKGFMNVDVRYYGPNQKLPFQSTYEDANMTFLCRQGARERQFFDDWMYVINPTNHFDFTYRDEYRSDIDIFQYDDIGDDRGNPIPQYKLTLKNAYPLMISPQPMTWADQLFQRVIVNFTYTHWVRDDFVQPSQSDLVIGRPNDRLPISR